LSRAWLGKHSFVSVKTSTHPLGWLVIAGLRRQHGFCLQLVELAEALVVAEPTSRRGAVRSLLTPTGSCSMRQSIIVKRMVQSVDLTVFVIWCAACAWIGGVQQDDAAGRTDGPDCTGGPPAAARPHRATGGAEGLCDEHTLPLHGARRLRLICAGVRAVVLLLIAIARAYTTGILRGSRARSARGGHPASHAAQRRCDAAHLRGQRGGGAESRAATARSLCGRAWFAV
jgi:hypothetical protein